LTPAIESQPVLEKYELLGEIGHGGMATVYRARDKRLNREVAIKVIHRHLRENQEVAARFVSEARAVAKVRHPNIVEVYDVSDSEDPERYLVVEFVSGTTLRKLLAERKRLPPEIAAALVFEVAQGLEHAHLHGVIHRDIKPENVLIALPRVALEKTASQRTLTTEARIKIADFGIAKLLDAQGVTSTGQVLGSPAHMAPEQIEGGDVCASADIFGLGVLLYECLVGKLPFDGKNPAQVLRRVLDGSFTAAERAEKSIGAEWSRIVGRALEHEPGDRYQTAAELADALKAELGRLGFDAPQKELSAYLTNPEEYQRTYVPRLVTRLAELGREARSRRDLVAAASAFNRALALRPDDPELLAQVSGLVRVQRLRRLAARGAAVVAALALFAVVVFAAVNGAQSRAAERAGPAGPRKAVPSSAPQGIEAMSPAASATRARARPAAPPKRATAKKTNVQASSARPGPKPAAPEKRAVRILITGPQNADVTIDGTPFPDWFSTLYHLPVGVHTFEFLPPNEECCEGKSVQTVEVVPGDEPQVVRGSLKLKDATLELSGPTGTQATCGSLGQFSGPGSKRVPMSVGRVTGRCTVIPPPGSGAPPKEIDVTLSPGRTFALNWP
jgi:serine/threonine-protein kinase